MAVGKTYQLLPSTDDMVDDMSSDDIDSIESSESEGESAKWPFIAMAVCFPFVVFFLVSGDYFVGGIFLTAFVLSGLIGRALYGVTTVGEAFGYDMEDNQFAEEYKKRQNLTNANDIENVELREEVLDRKAEGWSIDDIDNSKNRVMMSSTKGGSIGGHALTGVLTGISTLGMGNVAYSKLSKRKNKERIAVRIDEDSSSSEESKSEPEKLELLRKLNNLHEEGVITEEEYSEKKEAILANL